MSIKKGDMVKYIGSWVGSYKHGIVTSDPFEMDFKSIGAQHDVPCYVNVKWWLKDGCIRTQTDTIDNLMIINE